MTLSQTNFDKNKPVSPSETIAESRRASGYSLEDLAVTCGLTVAELQAIEAGRDTDPNHLRRVAAALKIPSLMI
ncbi:helix-turn-helix transcriptional regulator [Rhizobium sp. CSW-27]|uniref:helix-turn-helix domain-containing protein n=1 Tax=Rhizobium sp. CSW-27 TaxID=2839985 RepID=UPI001C036A13|nr:helix-turn-helix transcriptional regulator [Rhizobium sp. CSW-27]MBT9369385.1 helix-turn-helix transcriptional regulator [Rhizobium sp. CSW-27]